MNQQFFSYIKTAADLRNAPIAVRGRVLATALGLAIGCNLPIPGSKVDDVHNYYATQVERPVARILSQFNEHTVMDLKYAVVMAKNFWMQRYQVAHECPRLELTGGFFAALFGVNSFFSKTEEEFFNEQQLNINTVYNVSCPVVQELLKANG